MEEEIPPKAEIQAQESQKFEEGEEEEEEDAKITRRGTESPLQERSEVRNNKK